MAGVGKLLKQAQKMQKQMQAIQEELAEKEIQVRRPRSSQTPSVWE